MRLFLAITLPDSIVSLVSEAQASLRRLMDDPGVRWTRPEQFHYTLKFLGELPVQRAYKAVEVATAVCSSTPRFTMTLGGVGVFPNIERPSILWIGATQGGPDLVDLATRLDGALARAGFRRENKPPKAHLTLARIKTYDGEKAVARAIGSARVDELSPMKVDHVVLMQSVLKPSGSEYSVVERFRLAGHVEGDEGE